MAAKLEYGLLGPLEVRRGGVVVPVAAGRQRALLAMLLLHGAAHPGQLVQTDELTEALWGAAAPPSAPVSLRKYVKRLRLALGDAGDVIVAHPDGYVIDAAPGALDVTRFGERLAAARAAAAERSWASASEQAHSALSLWRGEPLADTGSQLLAVREVPRLVEMRLQAAEIGLDADVRLGRQREAIGPLRTLLAGHPLRERLYELLMLALYRDGQQRAALSVYAQARRVLTEALGTEPGADLRELHERMLTLDRSLTGPGPPSPDRASSDQASADQDGAATAGRPIPRQLPGAVSHFTGRADELAALTRLADRAGTQAPGTVVISAIGGSAGVGKTALAVHWAHHAASRFPDGQLYLNLRGYDLDQPMPSAHALAECLRALGVPGPDIPADEDERAAQYRGLMAGRRMLVLLDNAGSVQQIRPLLPASPDCLVLVTSRDSLPGLVARDGARRLDLGLLSAADARALLTTLIGDRAAADPEATALLAAACARLPLALRVAAERASAMPGAALTDLAAQLADEQSRLDLLDAGGDPRTAVRAVFSWSCRHLDPADARAFRLLGLHPGSSFEVYAAAALTGVSRTQAAALLARLDRAHLIQPAGPGRYGLHDLLRAYARELAISEDGPEGTRAALTRLFDHYLHAAATAMDLLHPAGRSRRPVITPPATPSPPMTSETDARAWLDIHRETLVAMANRTAAGGWPQHASSLAVTVARDLETTGHYAEYNAVQQCGRRAAHQAGDQAAEATILNNLGIVNLRQGDYGPAAELMRQALALYRAVGDQPGQGQAMNNLGILALRQGHYDQAIEHSQEAAVLFRAAGDQAGQINALRNIAQVESLQGRYGEAAAHFEQILPLARQTGDQICEASALGTLGEVAMQQGQFPQAARWLAESLDLFRRIDCYGGEASTLTYLAQLDLHEGHHQQGSDHAWQALTLCRRIGDQPGETIALNVLGDVCLAACHVDEAGRHHTASLALASQLGDRYLRACALDGLARVSQARGDLGQAREHWQEALSLYSELGCGEAGQVRTELLALDGAPRSADRGPAD